MEREYVLTSLVSPVQLLRHCRLGNRRPVTVLHLCELTGARRLMLALAAGLAALARLCGGAIQAPTLQPFPNGGGRILDFPSNNNIAGRSALVDILDLYRGGAMAGVKGVGPELDEDGARSLECHFLGEQLRTVMAAIFALRTARLPLAAVILNHPEIAPRLAEIIGEFFGIAVHRPKRRLRIAIMARIIAGARLSVLLRRRQRCVWERARALGQQIDFVHELLDPDVWPGTPSSVAFLEQGADPRAFVYYVTERQQRRLDLPRERWTAAALHVFFLDDLLAFVERFRVRYAAGILRLAWAGLCGCISVERANEEARALRTYLALDALFGAVKPRASLHTAFGNGRCEWAKDSGLVTAAARRHGVRSLGYQTRCIGLKSSEEFFESYDVWCAWGEAWAVPAKRYGLVKCARVTGDVNLCEHESITENKTRHDRSDDIEIVIFPFVVWVPSEHPIRELCLSLVEAVLTVAGRLQRETGRRCRVWIKAKDREDVPVFIENQALKSQALREDVPMACLPAERHEVASSIARADFVVAIGFTTPGMDAILAGKPAFYFAPFKSSHPAFEPTPPFVVHDADELFDAVRARRVVSAEALRRFDPYRDAGAATRLRSVALDGYSS